jgi:hypothetical protein
MIYTLCEDSGWVCENHRTYPGVSARTLASAAALADLALAAIRVAYI